MELFILLTLFVLGACFGSFINVLIDRLPVGRSVLLGRSKCDKCHKQISNLDLVPVISYLLLKGKCRNCQANIPVRVFLIEALSGVLFVVVFLTVFTNWIAYILLCAIILVLLAIACIDIDHGIISDPLLIVFGVLSFLYILGANPSLFFQHILSGLAAFSFFLIIFLCTRGKGIGFGDVKFSFFIGFLLSFQELIVAMYTAFLTGAAISIILVVAGRKRLRGETIPFGPFLSLGVLISLLFAEQIVHIALPVLGLR